MTQAPRDPGIETLRGLAIVLMVMAHVIGDSSATAGTRILLQQGLGLHNRILLFTVGITAGLSLPLLLLPWLRRYRYTQLLLLGQRPLGDRYTISVTISRLWRAECEGKWGIDDPSLRHSEVIIRQSAVLRDLSKPANPGSFTAASTGWQWWTSNPGAR